MGHDFEARLAEYKREVERHNELLAGADADLMTEREKVAKLEAKVGELEALRRESEWRIEALKKQRDAERERCARIVDPAVSGFGAVPYREERKRLAEAIRRGE